MNGTVSKLCVLLVVQQISVGNTVKIDWRLGVDYSNLTISEGTGLLFSWSGTVKHNLVEMMSESSVSHCMNVGLDVASGQVCKRLPKEMVYSRKSMSGSAKCSRNLYHG